jgi:hypothetical protein
MLISDETGKIQSITLLLMIVHGDNQNMPLMKPTTRPTKKKKRH